MKKVIFILILGACIFKTSETKAHVNVQDSLALVDFYNNCGGSHWTIQTNWLTSAPLGTWYSVTVEHNRVIKFGFGANGLVGDIPPSIGDLTDLQHLYLFNNQLTGSIPPSIGNLTKLVTLNISYNNLEGDIPPCLGSLSHLQKIILEYNHLTDGIPPSLGNLSVLSYLDLEGNQLSGSIPSSLGHLSKLKYLFLGGNKLTGEIPSSLGNLSMLFDLWLSGNQLTGNIPPSLGRLSNLYQLFLDYNNLTGTIPDSLSNIGSVSGVEYFSLAHNQLSGEIPFSLGKIHLLSEIFLNNNQLTGSIPSSFGNDSELEQIWVNGNHLSGDVSFLDKMIPQLDSQIDLYDNEFTFSGMEQIVENKYVWPYYSPQANIPLHYNSGKLSVSAGGTLSNNTYLWYNGSKLIATNVGDSTLTISAIGNYSVAVTNKIATQLTLFSDTFSVKNKNWIIAKIDNTSSLKPGLGNNTQADFVISLDSASAKNIYINYATKDGTAIAGKDYEAKTGTATFSPGEVSKSIPVKIIGNNFKTTNTKFYLMLNKPVNVELTNKDSGICTIKDARLSGFDDTGKSAFSAYGIKLYPNPAKDILNVNCSNISGSAAVSLYDVNGKKLQEFSQEINEGANIQINTSQLSSGSYFIHIRINGNELTEKFIKQ